MTQEIEIEFKNLLTPSEYNKLLTDIPFPIEAITQTNYYFETKERTLQDLGSALRIRQKNGRYQLTLKQPHKHGLLETHDMLTETEAEACIHGEMVEKKATAKQLKQLGIDIHSLQCLGSLTTERRELQIEDILLVLDYSMYNGKADYELELEATSQESGIDYFHKLLHKFGIPIRNTPNKIERFFTSL
ncbi:CYTH domain-containing protein [Virgibacillus pantothenticus]|uniref:Adenylate cyclase n=1 Tax=Virgibacillus pantothenticus TaxID=1473 RepID=A0A0L0QV18_VIRPA|nr:MULTISPECIES: CYTH domain-containing protein [Virgibacillus]API91008.1 adenylate cyclase [Virgibacillus sp. 6R]KNE22033.1 adenylate cyclase [Virgibacillus pantothenticus]MBS7428993.1 CYTH domain-containing protein [Virgibacillus sp. 19R1-5]MBU8566746.1 CYTH domain-containing protein [Virgibacillus pantothenticus]MBU8600329.1 CYTH domain-containing protein [Virgibacillus pantothenticus]